MERVDQVIDWLEMPLAKRPGLITLYFDEPDGVGHRLWTGSPGNSQGDRIP